MFTSLLLALLTFFNSASASEPCKEESLIHFFSQGKEVQSRLIGADDPCDNFGGNLVYSPKNKIFLYVNFNIPGNINLDQLDTALDKGDQEPNFQKWIRTVSLAVVDNNWIKKHYDSELEAVINISNDTLFISAKVVTENRFGALMVKFYSNK